MSSKLRRTSATTAVSASRAWRPDAWISMWCPATAPMVDTALMLRALTSGPPPVTLRTATSASKRRTVSTRRAAGRACSPWALCSATSTLAAGGGLISVDTGIPALSSLALISAVLAASVAASASVAPPAAETTAATRPSTIGASDSTIGGASSPASSTASSALSTALPRSMSTRTPSGVPARWMASHTAAASVPRIPPSSPAAISIGGRVPCTICTASSTAASANRRLWETTTMPIMT